MDRVELSALGVWGRRVRVELGSAYEEVWVQTLGDRTEALARGHEAMQEKLLEFRPGSARLEALTQALSLAPTEDLVELVVEGERPRVEARLRRELADPVAPRQDQTAGETGGAFAERATAHRRECEQRARERAERLTELLAARRKELAVLPREQLVELARPRRVDVECWNAFVRACDDWVLLRAVRRAEDPTRPYFSSLAEVQALHPEVKEQLRVAYRQLEAEHGPELPKD